MWVYLLFIGLDLSEDMHTEPLFSWPCSLSHAENSLIYIQTNRPEVSRGDFTWNTFFHSPALLSHCFSMQTRGRWTSLTTGLASRVFCNDSRVTQHSKNTVLKLKSSAFKKHLLRPCIFLHSTDVSCFQKQNMFCVNSPLQQKYCVFLSTFWKYQDYKIWQHT